MTLQETITKYFADNPNEWIHSGTLERMTWKYLKKMRREWVVAKPGTVGRTLRVLEERSIIAVEHCSGSAQYRYILEKFRAKYRPFHERVKKGREEVLWRDKI